jgi:putative alpha-1,2-mannosidase
VASPAEFSAPLAKSGAFSVRTANKGRLAVPGFLGKAVGSVHDNLKYWEDTFEVDPYVMTILKEGYRIPVKMTAAQRNTVYRERNNQSAQNEMEFVCTKVTILLEEG